MPKTKKPAATKAPKPATTHKWDSKELVQRVQDGLKARLISELDSFIPEAYPEEARFLVEVLNERDATGGHTQNARYVQRAPVFGHGNCDLRLQSQGHHAARRRHAASRRGLHCVARKAG